ncbi:cytochrome c biogenesis protein [Actinocatenispora thailandica]|uniref:Cytochrome c biogenesis protein n=1 Tax=Actinocatenispora thailandica TaxID=227318 RepID=A0A7R7DVL8_9ACTN|nr:cytochrome c biogenesis protein ResB [Actinocatenispora thailandica]BCJ38162.1 cytochrome c biogenesis protein [Actinocatenispora thailandica]
MATTEEKNRAPELAEAGREDENALSSRPAADSARRVAGHGVLATARRWWRQLTSMRTALLLLFLLAVAAAPGSLLPQYSLNSDKVDTYYTQHPTLAPILDKAGMFDVFSSPWFAAIYLLLFVSLVGCLTPRIRVHVRALRRTPPDAPRQLSRLRVHREYRAESEPVQAARQAQKKLRGARFRSALRRHDDGSVTVSAEKGFLRETGNLLFHFSLVAVLVGVAYGAGYGWHGGRLIMQGADNGFCNTLQQYDEYSLGSRIKGGDLPPFCLTMTDFHASFLPNGQPLHYSADMTYDVPGQGGSHKYDLSVNHPLRINGASVYLVGNGYSPVIRYTDRYGRTQTTTAPFIPQDGNFTSNGVALFPDANVDPKTGKRNVDLQMAFQGVFFPTTAKRGGQASTYPGLRDPGLLLFAYRGNTGTDAGIPHSVYTLDHSQIANGQLKQIGKNPKLLRPGQSWTLDDGTKVEFVGVKRWATLQIRRDPASRIMLIAGIAMLAGLLGSLTIRRRRVWFRFAPDGAGSAVSAGGLARNEYAGFSDEFDRLVAAAGGPPRTPPDADGATPEQAGAEGGARAQTGAEGGARAQTGAEGGARARGKD